jgi:hypothetical protein
MVQRIFTKITLFLLEKQIKSAALLKGLFSITSGIDYSIEEISDTLQINSLFCHFFLILANLAKKEKVKTTLEELPRSVPFKKICSIFQLDDSKFIHVLKLSFNLFNKSEFQEICQSLKLEVLPHHLFFLHLCFRNLRILVFLNH